MSENNVIHLPPQKVPLLKNPGKIHALHGVQEDHEKEEKKRAFEALYNNGKEDPGEVRKGGRDWRKWVIWVGVGFALVAGGVVVGVEKGWVGIGKGLDKGQIKGEVEEVKGVEYDTTDKSDPEAEPAVRYGAGRSDKSGLGSIPTEVGNYGASRTDKADRTDFDPQKFYSITLTEGIVYFGKIKGADSGHYIMEKVFYEQREEGLQGTTTTLTQFQSVGKLVLVKLGTEEHRPEDVLFLQKSKVLSISPLQEDSGILKAIRGYLGE